jgi:hypothetical protein
MTFDDLWDLLWHILCGYACGDSIPIKIVLIETSLLSSKYQDVSGKYPGVSSKYL